MNMVMFVLNSKNAKTAIVKLDNDDPSGLVAVEKSIRASLKHVGSRVCISQYDSDQLRVSGIEPKYCSIFEEAAHKAAAKNRMSIEDLHYIH